MKEVDREQVKFGHTGKRKKNNFISRTINGVISFFRETMISEGYARRNGLLQSLDPRAKLLSILAIVVAVSLARDPVTLVCVYLLTLVFGLLSKIDLLFFIKRVWLFIPVFTGVIILPMIFNVLTPGDIVLTIATPGEGAHIGPLALPAVIGITSQGLYMAFTFTIRVTTCVSAMVLLFLTTPQDALFKSLRSLGVPRIYVLTLDMCYRYIFLFMDIVRDLYIAKKSRTIKVSSNFEEQKWVGGRIGFTLVKSLDMSDKVHKAMISRGFNGDVKIMQDYKMRPADYAALLSAVSFSITLILLSQNIIRI